MLSGLEKDLGEMLAIRTARRMEHDTDFDLAVGYCPKGIVFIPKRSSVRNIAVLSSDGIRGFDLHEKGQSSWVLRLCISGLLSGPLVIPFEQFFITNNILGQCLYLFCFFTVFRTVSFLFRDRSKVASVDAAGDMSLRSIDMNFFQNRRFEKFLIEAAQQNVM